MNISIKETIEMEGFCPTINDYTSIDVTYRKVSVLGNPNEYAAISNINCPYIEECPNPLECPVARQRIYW